MTENSARLFIASVAAAAASAMFGCLVAALEIHP
jgi:hypothetical protein